MKTRRFVQSLGSLLVVFLVLSGRAGAQTRLGLRGGVNVATLSVSDPDSYWDQENLSSYVGPMIGAVAQFDLGSHLFVRLEPSYIQKGTTHRVFINTSMGPALVDERPLKLDFLQLPANIGVRMGSGSFAPYLFVGPNIGYMITQGYNRTDFALEAGIGADYQLSAVTSVLVDVRYSAGLNNLNTQDHGAASLSSRGIQPMVGVLFLP